MASKKKPPSEKGAPAKLPPAVGELAWFRRAESATGRTNPAGRYRHPDGSVDHANTTELDETLARDPLLKVLLEKHLPASAAESVGVLFELRGQEHVAIYERRRAAGNREGAQFIVPDGLEGLRVSYARITEKIHAGAWYRDHDGSYLRHAQLGDEACHFELVPQSREDLVALISQEVDDLRKSLGASAQPPIDEIRDIDWTGHIVAPEKIDATERATKLAADRRLAEMVKTYTKKHGKAPSTEIRKRLSGAVSAETADKLAARRGGARSEVVGAEAITDLSYSTGAQVDERGHNVRARADVRLPRYRRTAPREPRQSPIDQRSQVLAADAALVLEAVRKYPGLGQGEIAERAGFPKNFGRLKRAMNELLANGLIEEKGALRRETYWAKL